MEQAFGNDFSDVRVHVGERAPSINAWAFTQGHDLHFAPGAYRPDEPRGRHVVAHELAHVVQQRQGRVEADTRVGGIPVSRGGALEAEADLHAVRAARGEPVRAAPGVAPPAVAHQAPTAAPAQRVLLDPDGNPLFPSYPLGADAQNKFDAMQADTTTSHVFEDVSAADEFLGSDKSDRMHELKNVPPSVFQANLHKARPEGKRRKRLAPFKERTAKRGPIVTDNSQFNELSKDQLPVFPEGNYVYRSEKRNAWKRRQDPNVVNDNWKLSLYQEGSGPVAYNMSHDNYLNRTLFQYGQGKGLKKRKMAGMDGPGATPKWKDPSVKKNPAKRRKLNKFPHEAVVQGHGQDYEQSMTWMGDYDASHDTADQTLTTGVGPIKTSDDHPNNFSGEHPIYGQNFRNFILGQARTADANGSIIEDTSYLNQTLPVTVPTGVPQVKLPQTKTLTTLNASGTPQLQYQLPQLEPRTGSSWQFPDYAQMAESFHGFSGTVGDASMQDLANATKQASATPSNPSYIAPELQTSGINSWAPFPNDTPQLENKLKRRNSWQYLKPDDFK